LRPAIVIGDLPGLFVFLLTIPLLVSFSDTFQGVRGVEGTVIGAQPISRLATLKRLNLVMLEAVVPVTFGHGSSQHGELAA
jgi:hypothetical protein